MSSLIQNGHLSNSVPLDPLIMVSHKNDEHPLIQVSSKIIDENNPEQREISFQFPSSEIYELAFKTMSEKRNRKS